MRRQVIALTAAVVIAIATATPAWAKGDGDLFNHNVTPGKGHDVTAEVWSNPGKGQASGGGNSKGRESTSVDGQSPAEATKSLDNRRSQAQFQCDQLAATATSASNTINSNQAPGNSAAVTAAEQSLRTATAQLQQYCQGWMVDNNTFRADNIAPRPDPAYLGRRAVLSLDLPGASPVIDPSPSLNQWKMAAVGYPLWLSVADPRTSMSTAITVEGHSVSLSATRAAVTFSMGDGNSVSCAQTTKWSGSVRAGTPSPTCGYRYQKPSSPGSYRITASTSWQVTWSVMGQSGTLQITKAGGQELPVGELQSVVVR